jgi:hypothetical protein
MVETLATQRPDHALTVRVGFGRARRSYADLHAGGAHPIAERRSKDLVAIVDQEARGLAIRESLDEPLRCHVAVGSDVTPR